MWEEAKIPAVLMGAVPLEGRLMDLTQNVGRNIRTGTHVTDHTLYLNFPFKVPLRVFVVIIIFFLWYNQNTKQILYSFSLQKRMG